jgi:hypothetical protein
VTRLKHTFRLRPDLAASLADYARRHRSSQAAVVEAALTGLFAAEPDGQPESALLRRLDRMTRDIGLTRWHVELGNEAVAQFIRAWFAANLPSPLPPDPAQQAINLKRWREFVEALAKQVESRHRLGEVIRPRVGRLAPSSLLEAGS